MRKGSIDEKSLVHLMGAVSILHQIIHFTRGKLLPNLRKAGILQV